MARVIRYSIVALFVFGSCRSSVDITPAHVETRLPLPPSAEASPSGADLSELASPFARVIARPELYHGKVIQLVGYLNLEFEGNALYHSEEEYRHGQTAEALWIDVDGMNLKPPFARGWVIVQGTFNGERRGHFGLFAGTIEKITRIDPWRN